jgi:hypothetical protein
MMDKVRKYVSSKSIMNEPTMLGCYINVAAHNWLTRIREKAVKASLVHYNSDFLI